VPGSETLSALRCATGSGPLPFAFLFASSSNQPQRNPPFDSSFFTAHFELLDSELVALQSPLPTTPLKGSPATHEFMSTEIQNLKTFGQSNPPAPRPSSPSIVSLASLLTTILCFSDARRRQYGDRQGLYNGRATGRAA
jgi:hypothetical protein